MRVLQTALCLKILFILRPEEVCQISLVCEHKCVCVCVCVCVRVCVCVCVCVHTSRSELQEALTRGCELRREWASFPDTHTNTTINMHKRAYQVSRPSSGEHTKTKTEGHKQTNKHVHTHIHTRAIKCSQVPQTLHLRNLQTRTVNCNTHHT